MWKYVIYENKITMLFISIYSTVDHIRPGPDQTLLYLIHQIWLDHPREAKHSFGGFYSIKGNKTERFHCFLHVLTTEDQV